MADDDGKIRSHAHDSGLCQRATNDNGGVDLLAVHTPYSAIQSRPEGLSTAFASSKF